MPRRSDSGALPGNDGRWFLQLVGVVERGPESTDTYATLEHLESPPSVDDTTTSSAGAVTAAVAGALVSDGSANGEFVALMPHGSPVAPGGETSEWRRWRWWVTGVVAALMALAVGSAGYLLPRAADAEATLLASRYRTQLVELRNELPNTQGALADLTDRSASDAAVSAVPIGVADLAATSGRTIVLATAPLPATLPLVPRTSFDALEPTRSSMTILGAAGQDLAGRLGVGFAYHTAVESMFSVDALPGTASDTAITELSIALAADLAETGRLVAELGQDSEFIALREAAVGASQRYATWQLEYLDALREGDEERAVALIAELAATKGALAERLAVAMAAMRSEVDLIIVELAGELEAAIIAVPG